MAKKGPKGNKEQLAIALELSKGHTNKQVAEMLGKPLITVQKLHKKMDAGWKPDLSPEAIANAPESPGFMGKLNVSHGGDSDETPGEKAGGTAEKKDTHPASGYIGFAAIQIRSQYTPIMYMARLAAEDKWGWSGKIPFEDFMDTCLYHFFKDRGITLQGYLVDEEVNGKGDGKIKEMQEQIKKLQELVKGG